MGEILNKAGEEGVTLGVFIDESQCLYKPEPWSNLHELIISFDHCLFMTGCVGSTSEIELTIIKSLGIEPLQSLNDTKIQARFISGLTNYSQYCHYFDERPELKQKI